MAKEEKVTEKEDIAPEELESEDEEVSADVPVEETDVVKDAVEPEEEKVSNSKPEADEDSWVPKTGLGKKVKAKEITDIEYILDNALPILEKEIVEFLIPDIQTDLLLIGQSKGKFGGGQRRVFKQTQKKTKEGNKPHFATYAIVGNKNGLVGLGYGKSKETVPAREKAIRNAKVNLFKIRRGCGSWECYCGGSHSIPFAVSGKSGSVKIELLPAPRGTGLKVEKECQKILSLAGIEDVWSKTYGQTKTKINLIIACENALKKLMETKTRSADAKKLGVIEGCSNKSAEDVVAPEE